MKGRQGKAEGGRQQEQLFLKKAICLSLYLGNQYPAVALIVALPKVLTYSLYMLA